MVVFTNFSWAANNFSTHENSYDFLFSVSKSILLLKLFVALINIVLNIFFIILMKINFKNLKWKRYAFVANLALADTTMGVILFSLVLMTLLKVDPIVILVMEIAVVTSIGMDILSYSGLLWIQYHAVKRPLHYQTILSTSKIKFVLYTVWVVMILYGIMRIYILVIKAWMHQYINIFQIAFLMATFLINTFLYIHILKVAIKQKHENCKALFDNGNEVGLRKNTSFNNSTTKTWSEQYHFVITTGFSLILYWITVLPLWISWIIALVTKAALVDFVLRPSFQIAMLIWYCRSIFDPLIHLWREPKMIKF